MPEIFAATPERLGLDTIGAFARRVEALGDDGLFVSDAVHDAPPQLNTPPSTWRITPVV